MDISVKEKVWINNQGRTYKLSFLYIYIQEHIYKLSFFCPNQVYVENRALGFPRLITIASRPENQLFKFNGV